MENKHKQFKPYDKILVRDGKGIWQIDFYSHWSDECEQHVTLAYGDGLKIDDKDILPFKGNEYLVGTNDEPEEEIELKVGEWIVLFDKDEMNFPPFFIGRLDFITHNMFNCETGVARELCVLFSNFNPNDIEETKKHILCVKKGRIVKYKG